MSGDRDAPLSGHQVAAIEKKWADKYTEQMRTGATRQWSVLQAVAALSKDNGPEAFTVTPAEGGNTIVTFAVVALARDIYDFVTEQPKAPA